MEPRRDGRAGQAPPYKGDIEGGTSNTVASKIVPPKMVVSKTVPSTTSDIAASIFT